MTELIRELSMIPDVYDDFILGVVNYAKRKQEHVDLLLNYIRSNKSTETSDVVRFIMIQPDFEEYMTESQVKAG